jgi:hypothetical protein
MPDLDVLVTTVGRDLGEYLVDRALLALERLEVRS